MNKNSDLRLKQRIISPRARYVDSLHGDFSLERYLNRENTGRNMEREKTEETKSAFKEILGKEDFEQHKRLISAASYNGLSNESQRIRVKEAEQSIKYIQKIRDYLVEHNAQIIIEGLPPIPLAKYDNFKEHTDLIKARLKEGYYPKE